MEPLRQSISLDERKAKSTAWALTFADVVTLLLTFFVLLLVMLNDVEKTINVVIDKLLDKTYVQMTNDLVYDNISVDRETKGIKITIRGNLFKSASAEIDPLYFPVVDQIGQIIKMSELMKVQNNKDYSNFLGMIDKQGTALNIEIRCEGHTDDEKLPVTADYPSNWELSAARSLNIVRLMNQSAEMPEKYFSALGYGEFRPIVDINSIKGNLDRSKARAINRRVEIYLDAFITDKTYTEKEINI